MIFYVIIRLEKIKDVILKEYYVISNKYSIRERKNKSGRVYDLIFRVKTISNGRIKQKVITFRRKSEIKQGYLKWVAENCEPFPDELILSASDSKVIATVRDIFNIYFQSLFNQNKPSTIYDKQHIFRSFILPSLGDVRLKDLNKEKLITWQTDLWQAKNPKTGKYYSYKYLSKIRVYFFSMLNWAEEVYNFSFDTNSIRKPKRLDNGQKQASFWTKEEFEAFLSAVTQTKYKAFFAMLFYTGRRKGEILALTPDDVLDDYILINKTYTRKTITEDKFLVTANKNAKIGQSFICEDLRKVLSEYTPGAPYYYGGDKPISEHAIQSAFDKAIEKSGVKRIRIHDLRHSFASRLIHLGASPYMVADAIGDNVEQVYKTYGHLYQKDKENILKKL